MRRVILIVLCHLGGGLGSGIGAQGAKPLLKMDLVRLLSNPLIPRGEVADLIRRNCLAFRLTERDWSDVRALGADADVISSIGGCLVRTPAPSASAAPLPLTVVASSPSITAIAGADAFVRVQAKRGEVPQRGVPLALKGSARFAGGSGREVRAVTDGAGVAVFPLVATQQGGTYRLEVVGASGAPLPGRPGVDVLVRGGPPTQARVQPARVELASREGTVALVATLQDAFGNPVPGEVVELLPTSAEMGVPPDVRPTDSLGRATFVVERGTVRRPGHLEVRVRGEALASFEVAFVDAISSVETGFVAGAWQRAIAGTRVPEPLVFEVRSVDGSPMAGKMVSFGTVNASVTPDTAVTDSAGQVRVEVTLGTEAGVAVVIGSVGALRKLAKLQVDPGRAVELILEWNGSRVDGGRVVVAHEIPFALRLRTRDGFGNAVSTPMLSRELETLRRRFNVEPGPLRLLSVRSESLATVLTLRPVRLGRSQLTLGAGTTAAVTVEVVRQKQ